MGIDIHLHGDSAEIKLIMPLAAFRRLQALQEMAAERAGRPVPLDEVVRLSVALLEHYYLKEAEGWAHLIQRGDEILPVELTF